MRTIEFKFNLPKKLIAQVPVQPRDSSRLMVLDRKTKKITHQFFYQIEKFLKVGDVLVLNNTKVIPVRLYGNVILEKGKLGRKIEVLLLKTINQNTWECLLDGKRRKVGLKLKFKSGLQGEIIKNLENGVWLVKFNLSNKDLVKKLKKIGQTPTPPYIKKKTSLSDYQTVYATHEGSVAAPTAGFHFTKKLIEKLKKKGVKFEFITLHIGLGTFLPIKTKNIENHKIHQEYAILDKETSQRLNKAKSEGRRIIACGTTSVRILEHVALKSKISQIKPFTGFVDLFIYPGYKFKFTDGIITNFHLPCSTLLLLVSAFAGKELIFKSYKKAIAKKYRFYSFGDSMFII